MTLKKWIPAIICAVLMVMGVAFFTITTSANDDEVRLLSSDVAKMRNQLATQEAANAQSTSEVVTTVTGLNPARVTSDNGHAKEFMDWVLTWSTSDEYNAIRGELTSKYGAEEGGGFLTTFMPPLANNTDDEGNNYNLIDTLGYNMTYDGFHSIVTNISGENYTYFAIVDVHSTNKYGDEGRGQVAFTYRVDGDGNVSVIDGYTISQ